MKKAIYRGLAIALTLGVTGGILAGCTGQGGGSITVDSTRTQLYVGNYDGGVGKVWLDSFIRYFEDKYADISFEEGRTGVQVVPNNDRAYGGSTLQTTIANRQADVIFGEDITYYNYTGGLAMDITDLVQGTWSWQVHDASGNAVTLGSTYTDAEGGSIYAKMNASERDFYNAGGKYYGLPYYYGNITITYNDALFDSVGAFFLEGKSAADFSESAANYYEIFGTRDMGISVGIDGVPGTSDDGLPVTYEDFYLLCRYLRAEGSYNGKQVMPLVTCGTYDGYLYDFLVNMLADAEGAQQFNLNLTGTGTATSLGSVDGSGNFTKDGGEGLAITSQNMAQLQRQKGRYDVLTFAETLGKSDWFEGSSLSTSGYSNIVAQRLFIDGSSNMAYAMLLDGNWWESEATDTFNRHGENAKLDYQFKTLPIPKASVQDNDGKHTYVSTQESSILINNNIAGNEVRKNLAKLFVYEFHSTEQMAQFNSITGLLRPYNYTIDKTSDAWKGMSAYAQSLYTGYVEDENTTLLFGGSKLAVTDTRYMLDNWMFTSRIGTQSYSNPIKDFYRNSTLTAAQYFEGLFANHNG